MDKLRVLSEWRLDGDDLRIDPMALPLSVENMVRKNFNFLILRFEPRATLAKSA